ncbi:uncharacterized protein LOC118747113 [Rhagoletis pomonella]|uniref:uncharacterized protein LOC118747113 n=1 Tax=Rhagoletis pomonella TaxID=28610 RepID=UPI0017869DC4|nr:uncharacterized protein LOC118747113 [Rhagoletis pomonella]
MSILLNSETGETDHIYQHRCSIKRQIFDRETGEPLNGTKVKIRYVKHDNFQIPKQYLRGTNTEEIDKTMTSLYHGEYPQMDIHVKPIPTENKPAEKCNKQYKKEDFINMDGVKNDILLGYSKETYLLFLIPTIICFKFTFWLLAIEGFLHYWAHKKNSLNPSKLFYFRSPLNLLTSQFCALCRCESEMNIEIFQTLNKQMREASQSKTLKDVSKVIS